MNKHFEDTQYYLKRAGDEAKRGVVEELEPVEARFSKLTGGEDEPEPSRLAEIRAELAEIQATAEGEAKEAIAEAREKLAGYRKREA